VAERFWKTASEFQMSIKLRLEQPAASAKAMSIRA